MPNNELALHEKVEGYRRDVNNFLPTNNRLIPIKEEVARNEVDTQDGILRIVIRELRKYSLEEKVIKIYGSRVSDDMDIEIFAKLAVVLVRDILYKYVDLDKTKEEIADLYAII